MVLHQPGVLRGGPIIAGPPRVGNRTSADPSSPVRWPATTHPSPPLPEPRHDDGRPQARGRPYRPVARRPRPAGGPEPRLGRPPGRGQERRPAPPSGRGRAVRAPAGPLRPRLDDLPPGRPARLRAPRGAV